MYLDGVNPPRLVSILAQVSRWKVILRAILLRAFLMPGFRPDPMRLPPRCLVWFIVVKLCALQLRPCFCYKIKLTASLSVSSWSSEYGEVKCCSNSFCAFGKIVERWFCAPTTSSGQLSIKSCKMLSLHPVIMCSGIALIVVVGWRRKSRPPTDKSKYLFSTDYIFPYSKRIPRRSFPV